MTQPMTTPRTLNPAEPIRGFASSIRSVIMSSQLAACNLQLGRPPYAKCREHVRCTPDPGFRSCPSNDRPTSSTVPAGIGQNPRSWSINPNGPRALPGALVGSGFGFGLGFGWGISRYRPCFTLPNGQGDRVGVAAIMPSLMCTGSRTLESVE